MISSDALQAVLDDLQKFEPPEEREIPAAYFHSNSSVGRKFIPLIGKDASGAPVRLHEKHPVEFSLDPPVYIDQLIVSAASRKLRLEYTRVNGKSEKLKLEDSDKENVKIAIVGAIVTGVRLSCEGGFMPGKTAEIVKIVAKGYELGDLLHLEKIAGFIKDRYQDALDFAQQKAEGFKATEESLKKQRTDHDKKIVEDLGRFEKLRIDCEQKLRDMEASINELEKAREAHEVGNTKLKTERDNLQKEIENASNKKKEIEDQCSQKSTQEREISDLIQQKEKEKDALNSDLVKVRGELHEASTNRNLYTHDIEGMHKAGNFQIWILAALSFLLLGFLGYLCWILQINTVAFVAFANNSSSWEIFSRFISRSPYAILMGILITGAFGGLRSCVDKIRIIFDERLAVQKLSIIAKDVTETAAINLELSPIQILEYRASLRMILLKGYLKSDRKDYEWLSFDEILRQKITFWTNKANSAVQETLAAIPTQKTSALTEAKIKTPANTEAT